MQNIKGYNNHIIKMKIKSILLCFLLFSCNSIPKLEVLYFDNIKELNGEKIVLNNNLTFLTSTNDRIITFDHNSKTNFISIYEDSTYQLIAKTAYYGKGENEFLSIDYTKYTSVNENGDMSILIMDNIKPNYHMINIDKSMKENRCVIDFSIKNNRNNIILHNGMINDTLALCASLNNNSYYLYNYKKQMCIGDSIVVNNEILNKNNKYNLSNNGIYNMDKDRFFIYYNIINRISSFDKGGINIKDFAVNNELINFNNIIESDDPLSVNRYYMDCAYDSNYVYVLCANMSLNEYLNNPKSVTIDIFDWYSRPIMKLKIKEPLNTVALNKEKNILYGTTYSGELFKYNLPVLNNE